MKTFGKKTEDPLRQPHGQGIAKPGHATHPIHHLQRTVGNRAVRQMLNPATPALTLSAPGDRSEQEAERIADQVMRPHPQPACTCGGECPKCRKNLQSPKPFEIRRAGGGGSGETAVPSRVQNVVSLPGQPLESSARRTMEARFDHDFSEVRVHADAHAAEAATAIGARAFTLGQHLVFGSGQYAPGQPEGRRLLAHELTHVIQQTGASPNRIHRACLPAASCPAVIPGSAEDFVQGEEAIEAGPRARRRRMSCNRATSSAHAGRAKQLEIILSAADPALLARIHGIFIDADLSSSTEAMVTDCGDWAADALPAGCSPPALASATKDCVLVHGQLNQEAARFNQGATVIAGKGREDWRISTMQTLVHEVQHVIFDTTGRPEPPGTAACPRATVAAEVTEINAILSEFPIAFRAISPGAGAARNHALNRLDQWFNRAITNPHESLAGTLKAMRCACDCAEVDAHVQDAFDLATASWTPAERSALNSELRKAKWDAPGIELQWPL